VQTIAGTGLSGFQDGGLGTSAFSRPTAVWWDKHRITGQNVLLVADQNGKALRRIDLNTNTVFTYMGDSVGGYVNGFSHLVRFEFINSIRTHPSGYVYVCDRGNRAIRQIRFLELLPDMTLTYAGLLPDGQVIGIPNSSYYENLSGFTAKGDTEFYLSDQNLNWIRGLDDNNRMNGIDRYVAGSQNGMHGFIDGEPMDAQFFGPDGLWTDVQGRILVADKRNHVIRVIPMP
ncbi:MAG: hypothetical protein AAFV07_21145, partial [Bacteroidota bacterium]